MNQKPLKEYLEKHVVYGNSEYDPSRHWYRPTTYEHKYELIKIDNSDEINIVNCSYLSYGLFQRYMNNSNWIW